jgi:hypothetical protein
MDGTPPADSRSDDELLRAYLDPALDDDGEAFNEIWCRYRDDVRWILEAEGLSSMEAEKRIGSVFINRVLKNGSYAPPSL